MKPEDERDLRIFESAIDVANKIGSQIVEETGGDVQVITTSTGFIYANFCIKAGISMHESINLLMSTYKYLSDEGVNK